MHPNLHLWRLVGAVAFALMTFAIVDKVSLPDLPDRSDIPHSRVVVAGSPAVFDTAAVHAQDPSQAKRR